MFPARRRSVQSAVIDASDGADRARNPLRRPGGGRCRRRRAGAAGVGAACRPWCCVNKCEYRLQWNPAALPAKVPILRCWLLHIYIPQRLTRDWTYAIGLSRWDPQFHISPQHTSKGERLKCMCATRWQTRMPAPTASYHPAPKSIEGRLPRQRYLPAGRRWPAEATCPLRLAAQGVAAPAVAAPRRQRPGRT